MRHSLHLIAALLVVATLAAGPGLAQTEFYSLSHPFAIPTATTTRLFGMGGFVSCIQDRGFANPAFAGAISDTQAVVRQSLTSFDNGLRLKGQQASVAIPLSDNRRGIQLVGFRLTSDPGNIMLTGAPPLTLSMAEYEMSFHYGQRISDDLLLGVGVSPVFHNNVDLTMMPSASPFLHLESESDSGFRLGGVYGLSDRARLGFVYDKYDEDVIGAGPMVGSVPVAMSFDSEEIAVGLSCKLSDRLLVAVEWQELTSENATTKQGDAGWRFGVEGVTEDNWVFRAGSNDGAPSFGVGYLNDDWTLNYAYAHDWNEDFTGAVLGSSRTHQFELTYSW